MQLAWFYTLGVARTSNKFRDANKIIKWNKMAFQASMKSKLMQLLAAMK